MKVIKGGVTASKGFKANGVCCGIKRSNDLALVYSVVPAVTAGVFTMNKVQAAPVKVTKEKIKKGIAQAILINSGNANCCTGIAGIKAVHTMASSVAEELDIPVDEVLVASTGIIGKPLPIQKIKRSIPNLVKGLSAQGGHNAALAIMTTDTRPKEIAVKEKIGTKYVTVGGMAKGSGMICPNLATMICVITTDVAITRACLNRLLKQAVSQSFNSITVDGDTSTNDMVLVLANGLSGSPLIGKELLRDNGFSRALNYVCKELAKEIIKDGEGATKFIEIEVKNAKSSSDAEEVARNVANSKLVKVAIYGNDPNWGRIAASVGAVHADVEQDRLDIYMNNVKVLRNGVFSGVDIRSLREDMQGKDVKITIDLRIGHGTARVWTCDLSTRYIDINKGYGRNN